MGTCLTVVGGESLVTLLKLDSVSLEPVAWDEKPITDNVADNLCTTKGGTVNGYYCSW